MAPLPKTFHCMIVGLLLALIASNVSAFTPVAITTCRGASQRLLPLRMSTTTTTTVVDDEDLEVTDKGILKRDRYVVINRFAVRQDKEAKFEQRWATRKSRLATLDGFKYFHLMRRVNLNADGTNTYQGGTSTETAQENYVSFTIWEKKSQFSAWRKGDAFKEAHGGTSIAAFLGTMLNSAMVLRGAPRPAFFDGLYTTSIKPPVLPETVNGWRTVEADGVSTLPAECFVVMDKLFVPTSQAVEFEQMKEWKERMSKLSEAQGFVASTLMRRDGAAKGHGTVEMAPTEPTYIHTTIFQDRASYEKWTAAAAEPVYPGAKPSQKVFYEGTLVIPSAEGA